MYVWHVFLKWQPNIDNPFYSNVLQIVLMSLYK